MQSAIKYFRSRFSLASTLLGMLGLMVITTTGCQTRVCDARGPSDQCEIHNAFMDNVTLPYRDIPLPSQAYIQARIAGFPHAEPFLMSSDCPHCVFYVCDYCVKAEAEWLKVHHAKKP